MQSIPFYRLSSDGTSSLVSQITPERCPNFIIWPEHYRPDGSCFCNDKAHTKMREWGYKWRKGAWR